MNRVEYVSNVRVFMLCARSEHSHEKGILIVEE